MTHPLVRAPNSLDDAPVLHWKKGEDQQNFGDFLSALFLDRMLCHSKVDADLYYLVGSVIDEAKLTEEGRRELGRPDARAAYWCCGVRSETPVSADYLARIGIYGVRGPISRKALGLPESTPLGDPGLLVPLLHTPVPGVDTAGKAICIPHFHDHRSDEELIRLSGAEMVVRPSVANSVEALCELLDRIAAAEFVLSASLHGAIIACAYGRPFCFWDNGHLDLPHKWRDFSLAVGFDGEFAANLAEGRANYETRIAPNLRLPPRTPMLEVCPFTVRPDVLVAALIADGLIAAESAAPVVHALRANADANAGSARTMRNARFAHYRAELSFEAARQREDKRKTARRVEWRQRQRRRLRKLLGR
jgi:hypothetical protein